MTSKPYPVDTLVQAANVLTGCKQIDPQLRAGQITQAGIVDAIAQIKETQAQISTLELQLLDLRNKRDDQLSALWDSVKRFRATVKGIYGDDSSEYELVGGTRLRERKKRRRRPAA